MENREKDFENVAKARVQYLCLDVFQVLLFVSQPAFLFDQDHPALPSPVVNHTITYGTHLETTNLTSFLNDTHVIDGLDNVSTIRLWI